MGDVIGLPNVPSKSPEPRITFLLLAFGILLFSIIEILMNVGMRVPQIDLFIFGSFAFMAVGAGSSIAISLRVAHLGQSVTAGGVVACVIALFWIVGPTPPNHAAAGYIQVPNEVKQIVVRTHNGSIYSRKGNNEHIVELLVLDNGLHEDFDDLEVILTIKNPTREAEYAISCIPGETIRSALNRDKKFSLVVEPHPTTAIGTSAIDAPTLYKVFIGGDVSRTAYGGPDDTFSCPTGKIDIKSLVNPEPPLVSKVSIAGDVPVAPIPIGRILKQLKAPDLDQRLQARSLVTDNLINHNTDFSAFTQNWDIASSTYDEDFGLLASWLPLLRKPEFLEAKALGTSLTDTQASYLLSLLSHPDRALRLSAKETIGWLITPGTNALSEQQTIRFAKLLKLELLDATIFQQQVSNKIGMEKTRSQKFISFDVLDILQGKLCGFPTQSKEAMRQAFLNVVSSNSLGPDSLMLLDKLKTECGGI